MARYHGHPYDTLGMLPFNVVDPVKKTPLENLWAMGHNRNELVRQLAGWLNRDSLGQRGTARDGMGQCEQHGTAWHSDNNAGTLVLVPFLS